MWPCVFARHELLPIERERRVLDGPFGFALPFAPAIDLLDARVLEERGVEFDRLLGFAMHLADKHQERIDLWCTGGKIQLPRNSEFVLKPSEFLAERILCHFHEHRTAARQRAPHPIYFIRFAVDEEGYGWGESKFRSAV